VPLGVAKISHKEFIICDLHKIGLVIS
jgi:hypothetical protein